jgi:hypothetical protein
VQGCDVAPIPTENIGQRGDPLDNIFFLFLQKLFIMLARCKARALC